MNEDATYGGGLYMVQNTALSILPTTEKNHATYPRAICVTDKLLYFICYKITKEYSTSWADTVRWY